MKKILLLVSICGFVSVLIYIALLSMHSYVKTKEIKPIIETRKSEEKRLPESFRTQIVMASPSGSFRVPILMYHYVENVKNKNDRLRVELNITPFVFEQQVKTLATNGYTFLTAKDLGNILDGKEHAPQKPVLLTFDDGHWDFATDVLPILEKYHAKATAYIIPGFTGGSDFMTQAQVHTVAESGLVDIGAHTVHHISLKGRPYAIVKREIDDSKTMLEQTYHIPVVSFAYPNGSFDEQAVQLVKDDGFTTSVSTVPGIQQSDVNRFYLYRLRPGQRTGATLIAWLSQSSFKAY